jgi:hypothetical protein
MLSRFDPDDLEQLRPESQEQTWRLWISFQLGALESRMADFGAAHGDATHAANMHFLRMDQALPDGGEKTEDH